MNSVQPKMKNKMRETFGSLFFVLIGHRFEKLNLMEHGFDG